MDRKEVVAKDRQAWRNWLRENHATSGTVWLVIYKKDSGTESITYQEAVEEGLCYGWIDSTPNKRDDESYLQRFSPRNPGSNWSRKNKESIERLMEEGKMAPAGLKMVELAKESGTWDALNDVENLVVPPDLEKALAAYPDAAGHFDNFPPSVKRGILEWLMNAKRQATRDERIEETARLANDNIRANQYRQ